MSNERLLERIRSIERDPSYRGRASYTRIVNSILEHLQRLLNTRQGNANISEDYGIPDFSNLATNYSNETVADLAASIQEVIKKYEHRLTGIKVTTESSVEASLVVKFKVEGKLVVEGQGPVAVSFETTVTPDGQVRVKT
jgi:type VI secretion system protein